MTNNVQTNTLMESQDVKATLLAAIARIESIPAGKTLIDNISDQEWMDDSVGCWNICAGSQPIHEQSDDELDDSDKQVVYVA